MRIHPAVLIALAAAANARVAAAEVVLSSHAAALSSYVGRGVTLTNRPVLQPDASLRIGNDRFAGVFTAWANVEPARYRGTNELSQSLGNESGPSEVDLTAEFDGALGPAAVAFGTIGYVFPNDAGSTSAANTLELFARIDRPGVVKSRLAGYLDVQKIEGAYLEGALAWTPPLHASWTPELGLTAGWSAGQEVHSGQLATFAEAGLTHVDLSATSSFVLGAATLSPSVHAMVARDPYARIVAPGRERDAKVWFGLTVGGSRSWAGVRAPMAAEPEEQQ